MLTPKWKEEAKFQQSTGHVLNTWACPALSLFIVCPKLPRGQNQDEGQDYRIQWDLVVYVKPAN